MERICAAARAALGATSSPRHRTEDMGDLRTPARRSKTVASGSVAAQGNPHQPTRIMSTTVKYLLVAADAATQLENRSTRLSVSATPGYNRPRCTRRSAHRRFQQATTSQATVFISCTWCPACEARPRHLPAARASIAPKRHRGSTSHQRRPLAPIHTRAPCAGKRPHRREHRCGRAAAALSPRTPRTR